MNLQSDDFTLFGLPPRFAQDAAALDARWKALQRQAHPDRFAAQGAAAQRVAAQWSARINEAYRRLKHPLTRAAYLCELNGAPIGEQDNTVMPPAFLAQQIAWREALNEATGFSDLTALAAEVTSARDQALADCERLIDQLADHRAAAQQVRALMFLEKFQQDLSRRQSE